MAEFACPRPVTVSVRLAGGSVELVAEDRDTAVVIVEPYEDTDANREAAARTRVDMRGDTLHVASPESGGRRSNQLRIAIRVPTDSIAALRSASADLTCRGRYATGSLKTASGNCFIEHVTGDLSIDTASGDVRLVAVDGGLRVNGASADVAAQYVGGDARVDSASGGIEIGEAAASVRVTTASGAVRLGLARRGTVRVEAVSGDVSVGVAAGTGVWLDLRTLSGSTSSDLVVGDGAPPAGRDLELRIRTVSGDIDVHRAADSGPDQNPPHAPDDHAPDQQAPRDTAHDSAHGSAHGETAVRDDEEATK